MSGTTRRLAIAVAGLAGIGVLGVAAGTPFTMTRGSFPDENGKYPECPREVVINGVTTEISIAGPITDIPEFHDCQALINEARDGYGPVVGAYVWEGIDGLPEPEPSSGATSPACVSPATHAERLACAIERTPGSAMGQSASTYTVIQLLNFEREGYAPLRIKPGFSCVYLNRQYTVAWLKWMDRTNECPQQLVHQLVADSTVLALEVKRDAVPGAEKSDYPPVARWDWDDSAGLHYLAAKCGAGWCEMGLPGFTISLRPHLPQQLENRPMLDKRVYLIPGWYDQQYLASGSARGGLRPSNVVGTIVPAGPLAGDGSLESALSGLFSWPEIAHVYLSGATDEYARKMNFKFVAEDRPAATIKQHAYFWGVDVAPNAPTTTRLIRARIKAPDGETITRRVRYCKHPERNEPIPRTVRWRWRADDETTWNACLQGCCEVAGPA